MCSFQWITRKGGIMSLVRSRRGSVGFSQDLFLNTELLNSLRHMQQVTIINCLKKLTQDGAGNLTPPLATLVAGLGMIKELLKN